MDILEDMMRLRCAIYARYSSDQQSPSSIGDQIRKCREYAEKQGWIVPDDVLFKDAELSGAGADRPGLQRLLACIQERPRRFDVLLIEDTSRLSRRQADLSNIVEQLRFGDFRLIAISQGIDSAQEQSDVLMAMHGFVDSMYIKDLAKKTHRGLESRILSGLHAGGRCFGYRNEPADGGVRMAVNEAEAEVLRRIFEMNASGCSLKRIAGTLNAEGVPSPRRSNGSGPATWCPTGIRAMLRNETYIGRMTWNRTKFIKRPGTNKRVSRERPRGEWRVVERPDLRIIGEDLWQRVKERQELTAKVYGYSGAGLNKSSSSPYLLTGFLKCGLCQGNLIIVNGKGRRLRKYGCAQHYHRRACSNSLTIRQDVIERNYFARLQSEVLKPEVIEYTVREFTRQLHECDNRKIPDDITVMRARKQEIEQELAHLATAIATTGPLPILLQTITERERESGQLARKLEAASKGMVELHPVSLRDFVIAGISELLDLLHADTARARARLAHYTREIKMLPEKTESGEQIYVAQGVWDLFGECDFALVAGEGFEPSTFGL